VIRVSSNMPKRRDAEGAQEAPFAEAEPEEEVPRDLDLSSDEDADDEGEHSDTEQESEGNESDESEFQEALVDYMASAAAHRPDGAIGDQEEAGTSGEDHLGCVGLGPVLVACGGASRRRAWASIVAASTIAVHKKGNGCVALLSQGLM